MEEGGKAHHIDMGVRLAPAAQLFFYVSLRFGLAHIVGQLVGRVLPIIGQEIVHMYGVPDQERQKADSVLVVGDGLDLHLAGGLVKGPLVGGYDLAGRAVDDLHQRLGSSSVLTFNCWVWNPSIKWMRSVVLRAVCRSLMRYSCWISSGFASAQALSLRVV